MNRREYRVWVTGPMCGSFDHVIAVITTYDPDYWLDVVQNQGYGARLEALPTQEVA